MNKIVGMMVIVVVGVVGIFFTNAYSEEDVLHEQMYSMLARDISTKAAGAYTLCYNAMMRNDPPEMITVNLVAYINRNSVIYSRINSNFANNFANLCKESCNLAKSDVINHIPNRSSIVYNQVYTSLMRVYYSKQKYR